VDRWVDGKMGGQVNVRTDRQVDVLWEMNEACGDCFDLKVQRYVFEFDVGWMVD